jgi:hypothetical protein
MFNLHRNEVGAVLALNGDAVVAEGHGAHDRCARQGAAATAQAVVQTFPNNQQGLGGDC